MNRYALTVVLALILFGLLMATAHRATADVGIVCDAEICQLPRTMLFKLVETLQQAGEYIDLLEQRAAKTGCT
jgi:hypothetical protein